MSRRAITSHHPVGPPLTCTTRQSYSGLPFLAGRTVPRAAPTHQLYSGPPCPASQTTPFYPICIVCYFAILLTTTVPLYAIQFLLLPKIHPVYLHTRVGKRFLHGLQRVLGSFELSSNRPRTCLELLLSCLRTVCRVLQCGTHRRRACNPPPKMIGRQQRTFPTA